MKIISTTINNDVMMFKSEQEYINYQYKQVLKLFNNCFEIKGKEQITIDCTLVGKVLYFCVNICNNKCKFNNDITKCPVNNYESYLAQLRWKEVEPKQ